MNTINLCIAEGEETVENVYNTKGMKKTLPLSKRRYSQKRAWRKRRECLLAAQKKKLENVDGITNKKKNIDVQFINQPSTSDGIYCPSEEIEDNTISADNSDLEENLLIEKIRTTESENMSSIYNGSSIVNMRHMFEELKKMSNHAENREDCGIKYLEITGIKRSGLRTTLSVVCTMCHYKGEIHSQPDEIQEMNINQSAVAGTIFTGGSYAQLEEFLAAMNIQCMSTRQYVKQHDEIVNSLIAAAEKEMIAAAEEEKQLAIERGDILPGSGIPHIPVVADGSWMKRSYRTGTYNSASGVGAIIGYRTRKILFIGVRNKTCKICDCAIRRKEQPRKHVCFKNWTRNQASTAMEGDAIVEGFKTSVQKRGLIYSTLIGDGESSVYKKIIDADPYKTEIRVKKIECTNHLLRNFCRKMREIAKKTTAGSMRKAVENSIRRIRTAIVKAAQYRDKENVSTAEKIKNLYGDIYNMPSHVFGEHAECNQIKYFCDGENKENEKNIVPQLKNMGIYQQIKDILKPLVTHAESLLYSCNNNSVESFNGIVAKYIGGKRLNLGERGLYTARCAAAVLQYNTKEALSRLSIKMNKKPATAVCNMEKKRKRANNIVNEKRQKNIGARAQKKLRSQKDFDYGPNAAQADMNPDIYKLEKEKHLKMLQKWQERKDAIEKETIGQSKNQRWYSYKSKLLTASNFGSVCRRRSDTLCANLVRKILYPKIISVPAVKYGQECEDIARQELEKCIGTEIRECGIFLDSSHPFLGASPDGVIDEEGIVEIKCPKTAENLLPEEAIKSIPSIRQIFTDETGSALSRTHV